MPSPSSIGGVNNTEGGRFCSRGIGGAPSSEREFPDGEDSGELVVAPESIYLYFIEGAGDLIETLPLPLTVDFGADFLVIMGWDIPSVAVVCQ
jgi:hypothetical protein